jgi:hypothetical protein
MCPGFDLIIVSGDKTGRRESPNRDKGDVPVLMQHIRYGDDESWVA